jgi:cysteine desulfurase
LAEIAAAVRTQPHCRLHVDATQAVGKTPLDFTIADTMSFAPHKFYGLNGCGLLRKRADVPLEPQLHGGTGSSAYRPGTPAVALAASMVPALELALGELQPRCARVALLNARLRAALAQYPKVHINSPEQAVPHILNLRVDGVRGAQFRQMLDERDVCVSVQSACSADGMPSRAVLALGYSRKDALNSWRISLSHLTTDAELDAFLQAFDACYRQAT